MCSCQVFEASFNLCIALGLTKGIGISHVNKMWGDSWTVLQHSSKLSNTTLCLSDMRNLLIQITVDSQACALRTCNRRYQIVSSGCRNYFNGLESTHLTCTGFRNKSCFGYGLIGIRVVGDGRTDFLQGLVSDEQ